LEEPVATDGSVWKSDIAILDKTRNWTHMANISPAERIADRAVLDAIVRARRNKHPEAEIAGLIQIAQNAALEAFTPGKHGHRGKHRLTGPEMTVDELLERIAILRWPRAGGNGCFNVHCKHNNIFHKNPPQKDQRMIADQKMVGGECAMTSGLAYLLSVHVFSSQKAGFYDVYAKAGDGHYPTWDSFTNTFYAEQNRTWHEAVGDFWGGLIMRYSECGSRPKIRELFNTGVDEHRFVEIPENDYAHWDHTILKRPIPDTDPRREWGGMIWDAYNKDSIFSIEQFRAAYPEDLSLVIHEEESRIEAQHIQPTDKSIEEGIREQ
jgi:hypothetical protein